MFTSYGVPLDVMSLSVVNTPALVMLAMIVAPYLKIKLPPDSSTVKFVVVIFVAVVADVAEEAEPETLIGQVPVALVPEIDGAPTVL